MEQRLSAVATVQSLRPALLWLALGICIFSSAAVAATKYGPSAQEKAHRAELINQRNQAWKLFYSGAYEQAAVLARSLASSNQRDIQLEMGHLLARCYWQAGDKRGRTEATKIWGELQNGHANNIVKLRLNIAKALELDDRDKTEQAITLLEGFIRTDSGGTATAELAVELGRLYVKAKRCGDAKKALDFVGAFLKKDRLIQLEITEADAAPFLKAAKDARDHLKYDANAGLADFEKAERLRAAGKFREAAVIYKSIIDIYPDSTYAPRSELSIGHCLVGIKQLPQAAEHWRKFIAASPSGPWRGQAHLALIDLCLEQWLDLDQAARQAILAASHLPAGLTDEKAGSTWKNVAFDLHLRGGVIAFAQGDSKQAVASLEQARTLATGEAGEAIGSILPVIAAGKAIVPPEAARLDRQQMDRPTLALTMAIIHALMKQPDVANRYVSLVTARKLPSNPAQQAFAAFLQLNIDGAPANDQELATGYRDLLRQYSQAPWNDEVLYRLAVAHDITAAAAIDTDPLGFEKTKTPPTSKADQKTSDVALQAYRQLLQGWPDSPRRERAMWRLGRILLEKGAGEEANAVLIQQLKDYPQGIYFGDAWVRLIDVALEHQFDPGQARQLATSAMHWTENNQTVQQDTTLTNLEPWRLLDRRPQTLPEDWIKYEIYLRAGFMAYMEEDFAAAHGLFGKGGAADLQPGRPVEAKVSGISLYLLQKACEKKWVPWDQRALDACKTDAQRLAIKLADAYIYSARSDRAVELYERLLGGDTAFAPLPPQVQAYATWKLALAYAEGPKEIDKAIKLYSRFYQAPFRTSPWVPDAILRLGVLHSNHRKNYREAMRHYHHVVSQYPNHELAEKAMYFYCLGALRLKDVPLARKAVQAFVDRYSGSQNTSWRQDVIDSLGRLESEQAQEAQTSSKGRRSR